MKVSFNTNNIVPKVNRIKAAPKTSAVSVPLKSAAIGLTSAACLAGQVAVQKSKQESKNSLSDAEFQYLLHQNKYKNIGNGEYKKEFTPEEEHKIWTSRDGHEQHLSRLIQKPVKEEELQGFKEFLNLANGKAVKYVDKHFDNMLVCYLNLCKSNLQDKYKELVKDNSGYHDIFLNVATKPFDIVECNMLMAYKTNSFKDINDYLVYPIKNHKEIQIPESINSKINMISGYLNKQSTTIPIKTYRTESCEVLGDDNVKMNGERFNLFRKMSEVINSENPKENLKKLNEFLIDNEIKVYHPAFMSTSLNDDIHKTFQGNTHVVWELDIPEKTHGAYIEPLNTSGNFGNENEFLIQKGSDIILQNIDYDFKNEQWKLHGKVITKD